MCVVVLSAGYPGPPAAPKVVSAFKDCINLSWSSPSDTGGTKIIGYNLERNKKGTNYWSLVNPKGPITGIIDSTSCQKLCDTFTIVLFVLKNRSVWGFCCVFFP